MGSELIAFAKYIEDNYNEFGDVPANAGLTPSKTHANNGNGSSSSSSSSSSSASAAGAGSGQLSAAQQKALSYLPDERFGSWNNVGAYYESKGEHYFFGEGEFLNIFWST